MSDDPQQLLQRYASTAANRLRTSGPKTDITDLWRDLAVRLLLRAGDSQDVSKLSQEGLDAVMEDYRCTFRIFQSAAERAVTRSSIRPPSGEQSFPQSVPPVHELPEDIESEPPAPLPE